MYRNEEGITLIELLVTIAFIGIVVITSTLVFTNAVHVGKMSDRRNQAMNIAEMLIEDVLTYDYTSADLSAGVHAYDISGIYPDFTANYSVAHPDLADSTRWDASGKPLILTITVKVNWQDGETPRQLELTTYRAKNTL